MERKHKLEMIRYANSPEGTKVWVNYSTLADIPKWRPDRLYIVNDEQAALRIKMVKNPELKIQVYLDGVWVNTSSKYDEMDANAKYREAVEDIEVGNYVYFGTGISEVIKITKNTITVKRANGGLIETCLPSEVKKWRPKVGDLVIVKLRLASCDTYIKKICEVKDSNGLNSFLIDEGLVSKYMPLHRLIPYVGFSLTD